MESEWIFEASTNHMVELGRLNRVSRVPQSACNLIIKLQKENEILKETNNNLISENFILKQENKDLKL